MTTCPASSSTIGCSLSNRTHGRRWHCRLTVTMARRRPCGGTRTGCGQKWVSNMTPAYKTYGNVRENMCNNSKKRKEVMFFGFWKKKRKKRTYSFTGHLITLSFNTQLPKVSTGKSPTSNILLRNADTRNYTT